MDTKARLIYPRFVFLFAIVFLILALLILPLTQSVLAQDGVTATATQIEPHFNPYITYSANGGGYSVGMGDFNNDGLLDVAMTTSSQLLVYLQNGDGTLATPVSYVAGTRPESLAVGDLNNDGRMDVVIANYSSNTLSVFLQQLDGTMAARVIYSTGSGPDAVAVGDLNGDGLVDVAVAHWTSAYIGIFTQNASGSLNPMVTYASPQAGYDDIAIGDVNGDGLNDVVKMNGQSYANPDLSIFTQSGTGTLNGAVSYSLPGNILGNGIGLGDVTGDGRIDVTMSYGGNTPNAFIAVFAQAGNGTLESPVSYTAYDCPGALDVADVNADGLADVIVAHGGWYSLSIYLQQSNGTLKPYSSYPLPYASIYKPQGLAVGDINHDGQQDIVVSDYNNGLVVLYQSLPPASTITPTATVTTAIPSTATGTATVTQTATPTVTEIATLKPTVTSTETPTLKPTFTPTGTATLKPTVTLTTTVTWTAKPTLTTTATWTAKPTIQTYTVSGTLGVKGAGATIVYTGGTTTADSKGNYSFSAPYGWTGAITPFKTGYAFTPVSINVTTPVIANLPNQNFTTKQSHR